MTMWPSKGYGNQKGTVLRISVQTVFKTQYQKQFNQQDKEMLENDQG